MELRHFAEQVLFASSLEDKLRDPDLITDDSPGPAIDCPHSPGRPPELAFKPQLHRDPSHSLFPGIHQIENPTQRGQLLHFFANHELLATELMALVLLRFPDAPKDFRRGVLNTLQDEQAHTRLYIDRMQACGVTFGELPVSGYFWRSVAPMENPMDYVSRLSLTFEQANLDFCKIFGNAFAKSGDQATASLLDRIYKDEIHHVAYGLKWFRRWKNPSESDWEAFCKQLHFPLSPQRAKGPVLNRAGRETVGFDEHFIQELSVYAQSKGRTPNVFIFNPLSEGFIATGPSFTPGGPQSRLVRDLDNLTQFLARQDDVILVHTKPSPPFQSRLASYGFPIPEFLLLTPNSPNLTADSLPVSLHTRKLGRLRPWAWGPDSQALFKALDQTLTTPAATPVHAPDSHFSPRIAELYSKAWSAAFLRSLLQTASPALGNFNPHSSPQPSQPWLCDLNAVGVVASTPAEVLDAVQAIRSRGHHRVLLKQEFGLAGQSALRLWEPSILPNQYRWIEASCERGIRIVVEPWLERLADFSLQLEMDATGLHLCGYTGLINDARGQFRANYATPDFAKSPPARVLGLFRKSPQAFDGIRRVFALILSTLEPLLRERHFQGPIGIDSFVFKHPDGTACLKPVVEINPRYTMGRLTLELMRQVCPGSCAWFEILRAPQPTSPSTPSSLLELARQLEQKHPVLLQGHPVPRIRSGHVTLNDPSTASAYLACLTVYPSSRDLPLPPPMTA